LRGLVNVIKNPIVDNTTVNYNRTLPKLFANYFKPDSTTQRVFTPQEPI